MSKKSLSIFMLAMINVAAIGGLRNWPAIAEYGLSSLFLFLIATLVFFIPTAFVSAELATGWPKIGGIYVWVKEAFGHKLGFLSVWLLWVQTVVWYPTVLSFIAGTISYIINPALIYNKSYMLTMILSIFWVVTFINFRGMRSSGWMSSLGVIAGNFLPTLIIITLGALWYFQGKPLQIPLDKDHIIPTISNLEQLVFFSGLILSLCGIEMSAVHANDVQNPQKNYPRAILFSAILIIGASILGVLAIGFVVPQKEISLTAGSMQAIYFLFETYNLSYLVPLMAFLVVLGALASLSTWIAGPSKGLLAAAQGGDLPPFFRKLNNQGMPAPLLVTQALIMSILSLLFIFMPTVDSAYWILTALVAQAYLVMYLLMFAAAIKLRYKRPNTPRAYRVPGGNLGMWIIATTGILSSLFALIISFLPPSQIPTGSEVFYINFLLVGMFIICIAPSAILWFKKPDWNKQLPHEN